MMLIANCVCFAYEIMTVTEWSVCTYGKMYIQMGSEATRIWNLYMRNVVHIMIMAIKQLILQNDLAIRCVLSVWMFYYYPT